ncbi:hypothetical protein EVAR_66474_1 [Eumeta japonica]|uniref:Uncharacterized protein n=1 Tax=Eumeta variegata TaxID=151549 RepID=A0A4C2A168_EUMVA|nr:hypothetical protein EVAR_66474_1 [Eumeta japonica]
MEPQSRSGTKLRLRFDRNEIKDEERDYSGHSIIISKKRIENEPELELKAGMESRIENGARFISESETGIEIIVIVRYKRRKKYFTSMLMQLRALTIRQVTCKKMQNNVCRAS